MGVGFPLEFAGVGEDEAEVQGGMVDRGVTFAGEDDITRPLDELNIGDEDVAIGFKVERVGELAFRHPLTP